MNKPIEEICFDIYKSIKPSTLKAIIPLIDKVREFKNKPPIPLKEKMCEVNYPDLGDKVIMLHGVSVGEVLSLENLVKKIKEEFSEYKLVITTGTVTGQELAHKKYGEIADFIAYFPLDIYETCNKFVEKIKPSVVLMAETELWPNFAVSCKEHNVPLYIINGRVSDKSYPSYLKIKNFLKLIFKNYSGIFCQSELDRNRFILIGADSKVTSVMKNLKFEIDKKTCDIDLKANGSKVLIAGSTHKGEDEIVLNTYKQLRTKIIDLKMILAPRHLTRLPEIIKLLDSLNIRYGFRTKKDTFETCDVLVLDTLGELSKIYSIVDVAFIGGSFNNTGGHNPLEAIIFSKPVISGPSIKNFRDIYSILEREQAAFIVKDKMEFYKVLDKLLHNEHYYEKIVENTKKCFQNQQGALEFLVNKLKEILK